MKIRRKGSAKLRSGIDRRQLYIHNIQYAFVNENFYIVNMVKGYENLTLIFYKNGMIYKLPSKNLFSASSKLNQFRLVHPKMSIWISVFLNVKNYKRNWMGLFHFQRSGKEELVKFQ